MGHMGPIDPLTRQIFKTGCNHTASENLTSGSLANTAFAIQFLHLLRGNDITRDYLSVMSMKFRFVRYVMFYSRVVMCNARIVM